MAILVIVAETLRHHLADTGVETVQLLILGVDTGHGGLGREDAHEAG